MKTYACKNIRNICLMGHGGSGKTTLAEAMIFLSGGSDRMGKVADGNTICDFDPEEIRRKISISTTVVPIEWRDCKINIIDTPGYFDFAGEVVQGIHGADSALIVLSAKDGVEVGVEKSVRLAAKRGLPTMFFISKLDEENADFTETLAELRKVFGTSVCPLMAPLVEGGKRTGYIDLVDMKIMTYDKSGKVTVSDLPAGSHGDYDALREMMKETACEVSDELMEKYFAGEDFTHEETAEALHKGICDGKISPVLCGSAFALEGITSLMDEICDYLPAPDKSPTLTVVNDDKETVINIRSNEPTCAYVFKTIADPFVGRLSFFKVISGTVKVNTQLFNARTGQPERIGHILSVKGKKNAELEECGCGDIAAVTKLVATSTADTLCAEARQVSLPAMKFPEPCLSMAVFPKAKGDEEKIALGFAKLVDEDPTFRFFTHPETKQQILSGLGENHLDVLTSKLKSKFGVAVELTAPKVAYRETIRKKVKVEGKHKKQSGGHGQYGHVWIEFEPGPTEEMTFAENVFGGSVPRNFFPAVEKGLREAVVKGVLAGFPLVHLKATLVDGSYHDVDSSELAFKLAAHIAYKVGIPQASPVILEPIGKLFALVPDEIVGDVIGDINKRRGHMVGMTPSEEDPGMTEVEAGAPMAAMYDYAIGLRAMSRGRGSFKLTFDRYEEAPAGIAQQVIADNKAALEEAEAEK